MVEQIETPNCRECTHKSCLRTLYSNTIERYVVIALWLKIKNNLQGDKKWVLCLGPLYSRGTRKEKTITNIIK